MSTTFSKFCIAAALAVATQQPETVLAAEIRTELKLSPANTLSTGDDEEVVFSQDSTFIRTASQTGEGEGLVEEESYIAELIPTSVEITKNEEGGITSTEILDVKEGTYKFVAGTDAKYASYSLKLTSTPSNRDQIEVALEKRAGGRGSFNLAAGAVVPGASEGQQFQYQGKLTEEFEQRFGDITYGAVITKTGGRGKKGGTRSPVSFSMKLTPKYTTASIGVTKDTDGEQKIWRLSDSDTTGADSVAEAFDSLTEDGFIVQDHDIGSVTLKEGSRFISAKIVKKGKDVAATSDRKIMTLREESYVVELNAEGKWLVTEKNGVDQAAGAVEELKYREIAHKTVFRKVVEGKSEKSTTITKEQLQQMIVKDLEEATKYTWSMMVTTAESFWTKFWLKWQFWAMAGGALLVLVLLVVFFACSGSKHAIDEQDGESDHDTSEDFTSDEDSGDEDCVGSAATAASSPASGGSSPSSTESAAKKEENSEV